MDEPKQEQHIFQGYGVQVTNRRFVTPKATYALRNITTVRSSHVKPSMVLAIALVLVGAGFVFFSMLMAASLPSGSDPASMMSSAICCGGFPTTLGAFLIWRAIAGRRWVVLVTTSGGEVEAFVTKQQRIADEVVAALNDALIQT